MTAACIFITTFAASPPQRSSSRLATWQWKRWPARSTWGGSTSRQTVSTPTEPCKDLILARRAYSSLICRQLNLDFLPTLYLININIWNRSNELFCVFVFWIFVNAFTRTKFNKSSTFHNSHHVTHELNN